MKQVNGHQNPTLRTIAFFVCFLGLWVLVVAGVMQGKKTVHPTKENAGTLRVPARSEVGDKDTEEEPPESSKVDSKRVAKPPSLENNLVIEPVEDNEVSQ